MAWHGLVLLIVTAATIAMTWPLTLHLGESVIGPSSDSFEYVWKIYWVRHALFDLHQSPLIVTDIYHPHGYHLAFSEISPLSTFLGLPITLLVGEVASYNVFILLSTLLSGYFTYLWIVSLTDNRAAGLLAGLAFAFCPYRMGRMTGQLNLVRTEGFPLFFLGLEGFLTRRRMRDALIAGLGYSTAALASWYYGIVLAVMGVLYLIARARSWRAHLRERSTRRGGAVFVGIVSVLVGPAFLPYMKLARNTGVHVPLDMTDFWSASLLDFLLPNLRHPIWGSHVRALLPTGPDYAINEFVLSWGFVIMLLALYGRRWARAPATKGMCWMVWAGLLLSLGMTLHLVVALPILIPVPSSVAQPYNTAMNWLSQDLSPLHERFTLARESSIALPMPGLFLRWLVPGFEAMRSWGRFASGAAFAMVTLAGLGLDAWYQQRLRRVETSTGAVRRRLWLMAGVLCCLLLFEFWTGPQRLVRVEPRLVDKWLADQPGTFAIMQYPIRSALSGPHLLYTRYHGKKVIFGYGVYFDTQFRRRYPELSLFPADPSLDTLASLDVRYILLNLQQLPSPQWPVPDDVAPDVISQIAQQPRLRLIGTFDSVQVYEVKP